MRTVLPRRGKAVRDVNVYQPGYFIFTHLSPVSQISQQSDLTCRYLPVQNERDLAVAFDE